MLNYYIATFPESARVIVDGLTHEYTAEKYPNKSRAWRKTQDGLRLGRMSYEVRFVKACDFIHNTADIVKHDPDFAKVYLKEKAETLGYIKHGLPNQLIRLAQAQIIA